MDLPFRVGLSIQKQKAAVAELDVVLERVAQLQRHQRRLVLMSKR
jgi:hypothetical protein